MSGAAGGFAIMLAGGAVFLAGWTLVLAGGLRWARAAGVPFWRFARTYGQPRTDIVMGNPFAAGMRFWRVAFSAERLPDHEAEGGRTYVRRGAVLGVAGLATAFVGWLVAAVSLAE